jgi:uncharacterized spore protein YtfJ
MDVQEILQTIGERLQSSATVKCVYGDPITAGDRTVIPIARVKFAFGGGGGKFTGSGGGGGVRAEPAGMVEVTPTGSTFVAFRDYRQLGVAFAVGILFGMVVLRRRR